MIDDDTTPDTPPTSSRTAPPPAGATPQDTGGTVSVTLLAPTGVHQAGDTIDVEESVAVFLVDNGHAYRPDADEQ